MTSPQIYYAKLDRLVFQMDEQMLTNTMSLTNFIQEIVIALFGSKEVVKKNTNKNNVPPHT